MAEHTINILIAAGGTGGHVYPAIAIADAIKKLSQNTRILFVGTRTHMEWRAVPKAGYDISSIWISGFHRRFTFKNLIFPLKLLVSLVQSFRILALFKPHVVVSCGGYVAGPVGWAAGKSGIPIIIQEQNSFPGVTNRMLDKFATKIFTAFDDADNYLDPAKTELAGNPVRKELKEAEKEKSVHAFGFDTGKPVLLILGGSGGAKSINEAVMENIETLHDDMDLQIIWQCGAKYYDKLSSEIHTRDWRSLYLTAYLENMAEAYAAADLVISRAGASSCSELMVTGKPSIMVPSPNVAGDHQTNNAKAMADHGAAILIKDEKLKNEIAGIVHHLIKDGEKLEKMKQAAIALAHPDAAETIAEEILTIAQQKQSS